MGCDDTRTYVRKSVPVSPSHILAPRHKIHGKKKCIHRKGPLRSPKTTNQQKQILAETVPHHQVCHLPDHDNIKSDLLHTHLALPLLRLHIMVEQRTPQKRSSIDTRTKAITRRSLLGNRRSQARKTKNVAAASRPAPKF